MNRAAKTARVDNLESGVSAENLETGKKEPLEIFSEEVWLLIFDKVPPKDQYSSSKVCSSFQSWLEGRRTLFLSASALPLLGLERKDWLNSRRVCRRWRDAFDQYYYDGIDVGDNLDCLFGTDVDLLRFYKVMQSRPRVKANPFMSRKVTLSVNRPQPDEAFLKRYWRGVIIILQLYGKHVKDLTVDAASTVPSFCQMELLHIVLNSSPNLRALTINSQPSFTNIHDAERSLRNRPLPSLKNLVRLDLSQLYRWNQISIAETALRACDPLKLESLRSGLYVDSYASHLTRFKALKHIDVTFKSMRALSILQVVDWPLAEVSLSVGNMADSRPGFACITFPALFLWLNKFDKTLRTLELKFEDELRSRTEIGFLTSDVHVQLHLPQLKALKVECSGSVRIRTLDFVLNLQKLEELRVNFGEAFFDQPQPNERIRFSGFQSLMLLSNIWEVLPRLRRLRLEDNFAKVYDYRWNGTPTTSTVEHFRSLR